MKLYLPHRVAFALCLICATAAGGAAPLSCCVSCGLVFGAYLFLAVACVCSREIES